jgi:glucose/arabinose dehydrogenase
MRSGSLLVITMVIGFVIVAAGCTSAPGPGSSQVGTPSSLSGGTATANLAAAPDLTNQGSPFAATFSGGGSQTVLQPGTRPVGLTRVAGGFVAPMMVTGANDTSGRMFVADQIGVVKIIRPDGTVAPEPFLDIRDRMVPLSGTYDERGLLSLAFHPGYRDNGRFFVWYSAPLRPGAPVGWDSTLHLSEFRVSRANPDVADPASEKILLSVDKPYSNHNGGVLLFGPDDGYLYLSTGDGGGANDVGLGHAAGTGNAQILTSFLGKVLRIDVDHIPTGKTYGIPADNPFAGNGTALPEIFAYGLRNPAYGTVDSGTGHRIIIASAGQALFESAYILFRGGDYGWNIREGTHCFDPANNAAPSGNCPTTGYRGESLIGPIVELGHDIGNTIVGGAVYRGSLLSGWQGDYVYGTWSQGFSGTGDGRLLVSMPPSGFDPRMLPLDAGALTPGRNRMWATQEISVPANPNGRINAFVRAINEGPDHELYIMTSHNLGPGGQPGSGEIWKIVPAGT